MNGLLDNEYYCEPIGCKVKSVANGDSGLTLLFDAPISEKLARAIFELADRIKHRLGDSIEEVIPAYQSLTIFYSPLSDCPEKIGAIVAEFAEIKTCPGYDENNSSAAKQEVEYRVVEIPVCYAEPYAPDLKFVAERCRLPVEQIIKLHSEKDYLVHMLGFSPGFLYLGGLNSKLFCDRKKMPDTRVPAGSVGIGGEQTGVYPQASPGGWQIIGRTPSVIFDPLADDPFIAKPLDKVRFVPISEQKFIRLSGNGL